MSEVRYNSRHESPIVLETSSTKTTLDNENVDDYDCKKRSADRREGRSKSLSRKNERNSALNDARQTERVITDLPVKRPIEELFQASTFTKPVYAYTPRYLPDTDQLDQLFTASTLRKSASTRELAEPQQNMSATVARTSTPNIHQLRMKQMVRGVTTLGRSVKRKVSRKKIRQYDGSTPSSLHDERRQTPEGQISAENPTTVDPTDSNEAKDVDHEGSGKDTLVIQVIEYSNSDIEDD